MVINEKLGFLGILLFFLSLLVSLKYMVAVVLVVAVLIILFLVVKSHGEFNEKIRFVLVCLFLIIIAYFRGMIVFNEFEENFREEGTFKGQIEIIDKWEGKGKKSYVGFLKEKSFKKTLIYSEKEFNVGDIIESEGYIEVPKRELNKGGFSQRDYLKGQGIGLVFSLKKGDIVEQNDTFYSWLYNYKLAMKNQVELYLGEDTVLFKSLFFWG